MEKIERVMIIDFGSKATYGDGYKYIKTKIKTYEDSIITIFIMKKGLQKVLCKCLSIIRLDSVLYACEKHYP